MASALAACLCLLLQDHFTEKLFPQDIDDEYADRFIFQHSVALYADICEFIM